MCETYTRMNAPIARKQKASRIFKKSYWLILLNDLKLDFIYFEIQLENGQLQPEFDVPDPWLLVLPSNACSINALT